MSFCGRTTSSVKTQNACKEFICQVCRHNRQNEHNIFCVTTQKDKVLVHLNQVIKLFFRLFVFFKLVTAGYHHLQQKTPVLLKAHTYIQNNTKNVVYVV